MSTSDKLPSRNLPEQHGDLFQAAKAVVDYARPHTASELHTTSVPHDLLHRLRSVVEAHDMPQLASGLTIAFHQHDWIPGFAAFLVDGTDFRLNPSSQAFCVLNLGAILATVATKDVSPADVVTFVADSMMHEIMHVIEKWAGAEFSEERVNGLIERYRASIQAEPVEAQS